MKIYFLFYALVMSLFGIVGCQSNQTHHHQNGEHHNQYSKEDDLVDQGDIAEDNLLDAEEEVIDLTQESLEGAEMVYYVQKGDTLRSIAKQIYGEGNSWKQLATENQIINPNLIYIGEALFYHVTDKTKQFAYQQVSAPRFKLKIKKGETLADLSKKIFGTAAGWRALWAQNPHIKNPDRISTGEVVRWGGFGRKLGKRS